MSHPYKGHSQNVVGKRRANKLVHGNEYARGGRAKAYGEGGGVGDDYNTDLSDDEPNFQKWKAENAPNDSGADYDLRGAYKAGFKRDEASGHWGDRFKKPNHPTFSNQSQYATGDNAKKAGSWDGDRYIPAGEK